MSVRREFVWECNYCGFVFRQPNYGLPRGWTPIPASILKKKLTTHACETCTPGVVSGVLTEKDKP